MRPSLLQQQQQRQPMSCKRRFAQMVYSSAVRQLGAAQGRSYAAGGRAAAAAAPAAAAAVARPCAAVASPVLRALTSSSSNFSLNNINSSATRPRARRLGAYYSSDGPPDAPSSNTVSAGPVPAPMPADAYDSNAAAAAAMPIPAAGQQPVGQVPVQTGQVPIMQQPPVHLQAGAPGLAAPGQPVHMQPAPLQSGQTQQGQLQPGQMQPVMQHPPLQQQQGVPIQYAAPPPQQQGMPMQGGMPGQQFMQVAPGQQPVYMQQFPAPQMGQALAPGVQAPAAMGQMPAQQAPAGQVYLQQGPAAPAPAPAAALAAAAPVADFQEDWVNFVTLTGVVLQGPFLQQFGSTGKVKASLVLGLVGRTTGDALADVPRPILVETWGERAQNLVQQVQTGAMVCLCGHLSLDMRYQERSPSHGPALTVEVDTWDLVTPESVPTDRPVCAYKGEYDGVIRMITKGAGGGAGGSGGYGGQQQGQWQQNSSGQQQQGYQRPDINKQQAMQMFMQRTTIFDIAKMLGNCRPGDVFAVLVEAAEAEGAGSRAWQPLLAFADLADPAKARAYYNAVVQAVHQNTQPPTKEGHVRMKAVRDLLLMPQCQLAQELQQQEARKGGVNRTYDQVRLLLAMLRAGVFV